MTPATVGLPLLPAAQLIPPAAARPARFRGSAWWVKSCTKRFRGNVADPVPSAVPRHDRAFPRKCLTQLRGAFPRKRRDLCRPGCSWLADHGDQWNSEDFFTSPMLLRQAFMAPAPRPRQQRPGQPMPPSAPVPELPPRVLLRPPGQPRLRGSLAHRRPPARQSPGSRAWSAMRVNLTASRDGYGTPYRVIPVRVWPPR